MTFLLDTVFKYYIFLIVAQVISYSFFFFMFFENSFCIFLALPKIGVISYVFCFRVPGFFTEVC